MSQGSSLLLGELLGYMYHAAQTSGGLSYTVGAGRRGMALLTMLAVLSPATIGVYVFSPGHLCGSVAPVICIAGWQPSVRGDPQFSMSPPTPAHRRLDEESEGSMPNAFDVSLGSGNPDFSGRYIRQDNVQCGGTNVYRLSSLAVAPDGRTYSANDCQQPPIQMAAGCVHNHQRHQLRVLLPYNWLALPYR